MAAAGLRLLDLPNEILLHTLYTVTTDQLVRMRLVNKHFRNLTERIVHNRLLGATELEDWKLIIECYHPSARYSDPYVFCEYLGTPNLSPYVSRPPLNNARGSELGNMKALLARFRPTMKSPEQRVARSRFTGNMPGSRTMDIATASDTTAVKPVKKVLRLDSHENFSQLMFNASLVKLGPRKGVFEGLADVLEKKTIRVFRDWLARYSADPAVSNDELLDESLTGLHEGATSQVVWIDERVKTASLDMAVKELRWRRDLPVLITRDEEEPVSYSLELKELRISLIHLWLALERKLFDTDSDTGRAMIFGSFPTPASQNGQGGALSSAT